MLRTGPLHNKHSIADDYLHRDLNLRQPRKGQLLIGNWVEQKGTRQLKGRTCLRERHGSERHSACREVREVLYTQKMPGFYAEL